jgi:hypothetical protein
MIQGFRHLPKERREGLRALLSPYLLAVLDRRIAEPAGV